MKSFGEQEETSNSYSEDAELIGETLPPVAMASHTPVPVEVLPQLVFSRIFRQRRLDKGIVSGSGRNKGLLCKYDLQGVKDEQYKQ